MKDQPMKHLRIMMHRHMDCDRMTFALFLVYPFLSFSHPWPPVSEDGWMLFDSEIWAVAAAGQQFRNYIFSIAAPLFVFGTSGDGIPASWAGAQNHKFVRTDNAIFKNGVFKKTSFYNNNTWTTSNLHYNIIIMIFYFCSMFAICSYIYI